MVWGANAYRLEHQERFGVGPLGVTKQASVKRGRAGFAKPGERPGHRAKDFPALRRDVERDPEVLGNDETFDNLLHLTESRR